jgi:hypothetical protein
MDTLKDLFERHALGSWEKQEKLSQLIGEHTWELSIDSGQIVFNRRYVFPVQILGTESEVSQTWLWAWANEESGLPRQLLEASNSIKDLGNEMDIPELTAPELRIGPIDGHYLSLIASGLLSASSYYRISYEGGAVYVLITGSDVTAQLGFDVMSLTNGITTLISKYEFNHREAVSSYFNLTGKPLLDREGQYLGSLLNGELVEIEFDHLDRLVNISGVVSQ